MKNKLILGIAVLILGAYMLTWHFPPLPLNHEDVGLGANHFAHRVVGLVLIVPAVFLLIKARKNKTPSSK